MVLEATIGFNRRADADEEPVVRFQDAPPPGAPGSPFDAQRRPKFTAQDLKFAAALKINLEDEQPPGAKR
ncbi:MAG: hypothetical protein Q8N81_07430 [bacterium]|nr:hypothetical protein [bacterium]